MSLIDCDHRTPPAADEGYPYIAIPQLKDGHVTLDGVRRISREHFNEWTKKLKPREHDVIVVRRCNSGVSAVVPHGAEWAIGQNLVVLRADGRHVRPEFLRWLVRGEDWWEQVRKYVNVGAVFDSLKCRDIPHFEVRVPSLHEQDRICEVLNAIDLRIDLLRQTNATLESIAQALFKSWFIDFGPVRAKAEGREPEGMDAATAALFPTEFEESALGAIPKGWRASKAGDVFRITMGQSPPGETYNQEGAGVPFYQGRADFGFRFPSVRVYCTAPTRHAREGDVLVSVRAPVGDVNVALESCAVGRGVAAVGLDNAQSFALYSMKSLRDRFAEYESHGTVFGSINKKQFEALPCVIPSPEVLAAFSCTAGALDDRVRVNELQVRSLTDLRDSLLPRLISGKLRLPEAQAQLEEAIA
uniref:restriction endonuclease subunit S n=1 Tax=Bordetella sputigena TaxID=1416810 RepID=UPI0039EE73D5